MVRNVFRLDDRQIGIADGAARRRRRASTSTRRSRATCDAHRAQRPCALPGGPRRAVEHPRRGQRARSWLTQALRGEFAATSATSAAAAAVRAGDADRHGTARELPLLRCPDRLRRRRVRRGPGHRHAAGPDRGDHRRVPPARSTRPRGRCSATDGSWLLDGHIPVPELKDRLQLKTRSGRGTRPLPHAQRHDDVLTGRLPKVTDTVDWEGWRLEIVDMDGKTIDKVLATRAPEAAEASEATADA